MNKGIQIGFLARILAAGVCSAWMLGGCGDGDGQKQVNKPQEKPTGQQQTEQSLDFEFLSSGAVIAFEAELPQQTDGPIVFKADGDAAGGKYMTIPEGEKNQELNPPYKDESGNPIPSEDLQKNPKKYRNVKKLPNGVAVYEFSVEEEGDYYLWARHYWPHHCADSFRFRIDDEKTKDFFGDPTRKAWKWGRAKRNAPAIRLTKGKHRLIFMNREDGMRVDRFLLTTIKPDEGGIPADKDGL